MQLCVSTDARRSHRGYEEFGFLSDCFCLDLFLTWFIEHLTPAPTNKLASDAG